MGETLTNSVGLVVPRIDNNLPMTQGYLVYQEGVVTRRITIAFKKDTQGIVRIACECFPYKADGLSCNHTDKVLSYLFNPNVTFDPTQVEFNDLRDNNGFKFLLPVLTDLYVPIALQEDEIGWQVSLLRLEKTGSPGKIWQSMGYVNKVFSFHDVRSRVYEYVFGWYTSIGVQAECHSSTHKGNHWIISDSAHELTARFDDLYSLRQTGICRTCFETRLSVSSINQ